jgi:iron complex transport system substrate-binding protein
MRLRTLSTLTLTGALALVAACGDDDDATTEAVETTEATETTEVVETTEAVEATEAPATTAATTSAPATGGYVPGADPDADAAALAWTTAFDSTLGYDAKATAIADAAALRPTIEAYTPAGDAVGGITLEPTAVVVTGDTAAITYKVLFAGTSPYPEQDGTVQRVDGVWVVGREEFCAFMGMARNPCP